MSNMEVCTLLIDRALEKCRKLKLLIITNNNWHTVYHTGANGRKI